MLRGFTLGFAFTLVAFLSFAFASDTLALWAYVLVGVLAVITARLFPRGVAMAALAVGPAIGWMWSISLPPTVYTERIFAGSIDVPVSEVIAAVGLMSMLILLLHEGRWTQAWKRLPFVYSYAALVGAHLVSAFSAARPDPLAVIKFSLRPVAFSYVAYVALPVLLLRSWQKVRQAFGLFVIGASLFALQGLASLVVNERWQIGIAHRARPLSVFGVYPIGANHNVLAEWLVVAAPFALALAAWTHDRALRRWLSAAAVLCYGVALLTFARSAWIVMVVQSMVLFATVWRPALVRVWKVVRRGAWVLFAPLVAYMGWFSLRAEVASSTDARAMLTGIAWQWFTLHPLVGAGAGTFVSRVDATWSYRLLFGGAMDAHGVVQKLLAETGLIGITAYLLVSVVIARLAVMAVRRMGWVHRMGEGLVFAAVGMMGAWVYQLFNTTYWSAKLWLPIGLFFAAANLCRRSKYV